MPHSDPARYEFLWGPQAYVEISEWHILKHLFKSNQGASRSFPLPSAEAEREEEEGP